jgi:hypothetical protein
MNCEKSLGIEKTIPVIDLLIRDRDGDDNLNMKELAMNSNWNAQVDDKVITCPFQRRCKNGEKRLAETAETFRFSTPRKPHNLRSVKCFHITTVFYLKSCPSVHFRDVWPPIPHSPFLSSFYRRCISWRLNQ